MLFNRKAYYDILTDDEARGFVFPCSTGFCAIGLKLGISFCAMMNTDLSETGYFELLLISDRVDREDDATAL